MGVRRAYVWRGRMDGVYYRPWVAEISPQDVVDPALPVYVRAQGAYSPETKDFRTHEEAIAWADKQVSRKVGTWRHETWGLIHGRVMVERARAAWVRVGGRDYGGLPVDLRIAITAALTEPPARPEGAEAIADLLASRGVRVVSEDGAA